MRIAGWKVSSLIGCCLDCQTYVSSLIVADERLCGACGKLLSSLCQSDESSHASHNLPVFLDDGVALEKVSCGQDLQ
jgi:hypothetical protein